MTRYINEQGEVYNGRYVVADGIKYISPSREKLAELGYHVVVEQPQVNQPTTEDLADDLRGEFDKTDWKIIKTMEYRMLGLPDPYNVQELHEERQAIRDEINELEGGGEQ